MDLTKLQFATRLTRKRKADGIYSLYVTGFSNEMPIVVNLDGPSCSCRISREQPCGHPDIAARWEEDQQWAPPGHFITQVAETAAVFASVENPSVVVARVDTRGRYECTCPDHRAYELIVQWSSEQVPDCIYTLATVALVLARQNG